jgi:colanic acid/amylovoran biosynthesis protein
MTAHEMPSAPDRNAAPDLSPLRVALLWHSLRSDNLGVGALTIAHMRIIREAAAAARRSVTFDIVGFGGGQYYPPAEQDFSETQVRGSKNLLPGFPVWKALGRADIVLDIGAGDSFADIYGAKRFIWMWVPKLMALLQGKPLVLAPQTIGPFRNPVYTRLASFAMKRCRKIFARDGQSKAVLDQEKLGDIAAETVDVAFRLPFERQTRAPDGRIRFGLNVSGLLYAGGYTGQNQFGIKGDYRAMIDQIITKLLARGDTDVVLVPHVITAGGDSEDDIHVSRIIAEKFPACTIAPRFASPSEAKSFISGLDVLAGSRMHATIAAVSSGIAVVPLAYSRKFSGLFAAVGYPLVGDCTKQDEAELVALTLDAVERRVELAAAAQRSNAIAQERLGVYSAFLTELMLACPGRSMKHQIRS